MNEPLTIHILGPGCTNCRRLDDLTRSVLEELDAVAEIHKVTDPTAYLDYDVMSTPGLVINGETVVSGRVPAREEIVTFVTSALAGASDSE